jgi:hypothetical protein
MMIREQDELKKVHEERERSFGRGQDGAEDGAVHHTDLNQIYEELRRLMCERSSGPSRIVVGGGVAQQRDEWIRTSVWILDELGGGHHGGWHCVV